MVIVEKQFHVAQAGQLITMAGWLESLVLLLLLNRVLRRWRRHSPSPTATLWFLLW